MKNIEMPLTANINTCPTVYWCYGEKLLKVPLHALLDLPMSEQSYTEAIGYSVQDIFDRFEQLCLDRIPVEVKPWPGNDSLYVQILHNALLDYDHEYSPNYRK